MALISSPSSSSCSNTCQLNFKHDVFISFRGEDTRYNFTGHLFKALRDKQIEYYIDEKLNRGDEISPSLLTEIEVSKISVIIFSKHYASSRWCLQELVKILECKKSYGQTVIPVFYNAVPTDVRNQTGTYGDAFTKHNQQQSSDQVQRWKDALKEAANLSGLNLSTIKDESVLIKNIVEDILKRLNDMSASDAKGLVGIDKRIEQIESLLGREDVCSVGIWGMGGIGKTTLAEAVFNRICSQFEGFYFIPNIREESELNGGLNHMRRELLSTLLEDGNVNIGTAIARRTFTRNRFGHKKLLIVFDDVTNFQQIETLIGGFDRLNSQSRIIITTRDRQVLRNCRVNQVYEVQRLFHHEALELFHRHAFKESHPSKDYMELSKRVCEYTGGVPLALKVLGSFLCNRREQEWVSALSKLERIANNDIQKVLKISYDGLDDEEQRIFLDIACFFNGKNKDFVINILNACGFSTEIGVSVLSDKSLISLLNDNIITMHDLLQAMAREIVRQECPIEPGKRSRLWNYDDIYHVLTKDKGTEMIEAVSLDMSSSNAIDINLTPRAFAKMEKLRLLKFYVSNVRDNRGNRVHVLDEGFEFVFNELKYLHWYGFPLKSLQPNFQLENLVILEMPNSDVEELWSGFKQLDNLKRIDLTGSRQLIRCPDLSRTPNLESLNLCKCESLTSIPNCTGLKSLKELILCECSKLKKLPKLPNNLETLGLSGCKSLVPPFFKYLNKVRSLDLCGCQSLISILDLRGWKSLKYLGVWWCLMLPKVPNSIEAPSFEDLDSLKYLYLNNFSMHKSLPSSIYKLKSLETLCLFVCSKIDKLSDDIGTLESLKSIDAGGTTIREIPPSISCLKRLDSLNFSGCKGENAVGLILPPLLGLDNLRKLYLSDCGITELPDNLGCLTSLETLCLDRNHFQSIPGSIINLSKLRFLDISHCERIKVLPKLQYWTSISAVNCTSLEELSCHSFHKNSFDDGTVVANFANCFKLNQNSLNYFLEGTVQEMQGLATSIEKLYESYDQVYAGESPPASICYPENDIPKWFSFRSMGSFIDVKLPPDWFNYTFIYLALSVVVTISDPDHQSDHQGDYYNKYSNVNYEVIVKSKDEDRYFDRINMSGDDLYSLFEVPYCGPDYIKPNHVIIGFGYSFFRELCDDEFSFRFYIKNKNESNIELIKVVQCGVHLMFGLNLETSGDNASQEIETHRITPRDQGAVPEMQGLATSIEKKYDKVYDGESPLASICYPENDIPKWFSFRSTGSFIDVKLPSHWFKYNFLCFALSVVVTNSDPDHQCDHQRDYDDKYLNVNYEGVVKSKDEGQCCDRINMSRDNLILCLRWLIVDLTTLCQTT